MAKFMMLQQQIMPYAGTAYLNGAVKTSGHDFVLHLGSDIDDILNEVSREEPDCIGFSCMTGLHNKALEIATDIKKNFDIPIIMGGPHATLFPDVIKEPSIDIICRGEGEFSIIDLLDAIERQQSYNTIENLWVKDGRDVHKNEMRTYPETLDDIPLIDWTCYDGTAVKKHSPVAFLVRGCPYSCSYCFNEGLRNMTKNLGKYIRAFSVDRSIQEIKQALDFFENNPVVFTSDTFGIDLEWMESLFERYTNMTDLPFVLLLRPELASENTINILKKYNCYSVAIGVESGSERVRKEILNRKYSNQRLLTVAENLHNAGIKFRTYNIIGLPTETEDELWKTIELNIKMKTDFPRGAIFTPFPETKIVDIAKEHGYIDEHFSYDSIPDTILSHSILKNIDHDRIKNSLYFFQTAIIMPRLKNVLRGLSHYKPNILYKAWFSFIYLYLLRKSERKKLIPFISFLFSYALKK